MNLDSTIKSLLEQQKYSEALQLLEKSLKGSDDKVTLYAAMGYCTYKLAEFSKSVEHYSLALALAPDQAQLYSDRGLSYFMMGVRQAALQDFNTAQELEPQNPYRYSSRAYVKDAFGDTKGAIADYQKTLELDPEDSVAYNNLGLVLEKLGYRKEAQQHFSKADALEGRQTEQPEPQEENRLAAPVQPPAQPEQKESLSLQHLGQVMRSIFTTRQGFQEFLQFWLGRKTKKP